MNKRQIGPSTMLFPMPTMLVAAKTGEGSANILTILFMGEVVEIHINEAILNERGTFVTERLDPLVFMRNIEYRRLCVKTVLSGKATGKVEQGYFGLQKGRTA